MRIRPGRARSLVGGILGSGDYARRLVDAEPFRRLWRAALPLYEVDTDADTGEFCPRCGRPTGTEDQFCRHCGASLQ
jgi:hypothetical protein